MTDREAAKVKLLMRGERDELNVIARQRALLDVQERAVRARYATLRQLDKPGETASAPLDPHTQAGHGNIAKVKAAFSRRSEATGADLERLTGVGSGSVSWAIRALISDGVIEDTGERRPTAAGGSSKLYRRLPKPARVTRKEPGS